MLYHLNYNPNYILHSKISGSMVSTLNYDPCYTLHLAVNFAVILDGKPKFWVQSVIESIVYNGNL